jgi:hypothetical protein
MQADPSRCLHIQIVIYIFFFERQETIMRSLGYLMLAAIAMTWALPVAAAELLMFRRDGCAWCESWDREIGPIYGKTDVGRRAPLRMVDIRRDRHAAVLKSPIIYTPTFVLVENGREIARIEGYAGDHFFWGQIEHLVGRLPRGAARVLSTTH